MLKLICIVWIMLVVYNGVINYLEGYMIDNMGECIHSMRVGRGFSQESLASEIGVSRQAISKWERGEALPDIYNIMKLSEIFGLTVDDLMKGDTELKVNLTKEEEKPIVEQIRETEYKTYYYNESNNSSNNDRNILLRAIGISCVVLASFTFVIIPHPYEFIAFSLLLTIGIGLIVFSGLKDGKRRKEKRERRKMRKYYDEYRDNNVEAVSQARYENDDSNKGNSQRRSVMGKADTAMDILPFIIKTIFKFL